jgi:hypothetical protein
MQRSSTSEKLGSAFGTLILTVCAALFACFFILFFILGGLLMTRGIMFIVKEGQYATTGALSSGRIVAKTVEYARRAARGHTYSTMFVISYRFTTARGESVKGREVTQDDRAWEALRVGGAISVQYLPDNPNSNRAAEHLADNISISDILLSDEANTGGMGGAVIRIIAGLLLGGLGGRMFFIAWRVLAPHARS